MSYKCYRCHKVLDDKVTKCDKCGAKKINFSKKEEKEKITKNIEYPVSIMYLLLIFNIIFLVLAFFNYNDSSLLFPFIGLALICILFSYIFYYKYKIVRVIILIEALTVYLVLFIIYLFINQLYYKCTHKRLIKE